MGQMWKPEIQDWEKIGLESYKFIFEQAKSRFEEIMSESEILTARALQLLLVLIGILSAIIGVSLKDLPPVWLVTIAGILYVIDTVLLYKLLYGRDLVMRGSPPSEIFIKRLDRTDYSEDEQLLALYYNEIRRYQDRIETNAKITSRRQKLYYKALIVSIVLAILTGTMILGSLYTTHL